MEETRLEVNGNNENSTSTLNTEIKTDEQNEPLDIEP
jgi:hypothetical protein